MRLISVLGIGKQFLDILGRKYPNKNNGLEIRIWLVPTCKLGNFRKNPAKTGGYADFWEGLKVSRSAN